MKVCATPSKTSGNIAFQCRLEYLVASYHSKQKSQLSYTKSYNFGYYSTNNQLKGNDTSLFSNCIQNDVVSQHPCLSVGLKKPDPYNYDKNSNLEIPFL